MTDRTDGLHLLSLLKHMHMNPLSACCYFPLKTEATEPPAPLAHSMAPELNFHESLSLSCSVHHFSRSALYG